MLARFVLMSSILSAGSALQATADQRGPDAHVIRQDRGDVFVIGNAAEADRYVRPVTERKYRPVRAGQRLAAAFLDPRYVVAAPAGYRPVRKGRRWIRYGDDLLLVHVRSGHIERVLPGGYRRRRGS